MVHARSRRLSNLLTDLQLTTSSSEKVQLLQAYDTPFLRYLLHQALSKDIRFHLTIDPDELSYGSNCIEDFEVRVQMSLEFLSLSQKTDRNWRLASDIAEQLGPGDQELFCAVVNKKLGAGVGKSIVNQAFPGLIKSFKVQLARKVDDINALKGKWYWSPKLDGIRVIALREDEQWKLYTRAGKEIEQSLGYWKPSLEKIYQAYGHTFFDGEAYKHGERFETIQGSVIRKDINLKCTLSYHVFVVGDAEDFRHQRTESISPVFDGFAKDINLLQPVHKGLIFAGSVPTVLEQALLDGYEGIVLRDFQHVYDYKRSPYLLKIKPVDFTEVRVTRIIYGDMPVLSNGVQHTEYLPVALEITDGSMATSCVGSGFNLNFRRQLYKDPSIVLNKIIEIAHQGRLTNGGFRFPVFKRIREDKDAVA